MKFILSVIPHKQQRYNTLGDYYYKNGCWHIVISDKLNKDEQFAAMIHELIELYLTQKRGIKEQQITLFDKQHPNHSDPGFHPLAPYHKEHIFAHIVEHFILEEVAKCRGEK